MSSARRRSAATWWCSARPKDDSIDYIKRVIGLPGDRIQMIDGLLHINGVPVKRERVGDFIDDENGAAERVRRWRETLPNGVSYETLDLGTTGFSTIPRNMWSRPDTTS